MSDTKLPPPNREGFKTFADWAINACCEKYTSTQNTCENPSEITRKSNASDLISREDAIDALWKALYEYEDKTEKQFQESDELDVGDWILHRIFVQNMSDIDRKTILNLPSAERTEWIPCSEKLPKVGEQCLLTVHEIGWGGFEYNRVIIGFYSDNYKNHILAWMPLPTPYKGDE